MSLHITTILYFFFCRSNEKVIFILLIEVIFFFFLLNFKELISISQLAADNAAAAAKLLQLCLTLCDPIDSSSPGSPIPGILQARTLEWVAISSSSAWKRKEKVKSLSRVPLFATPWTAAYQAPLSMGFFQARVLEWVAIAFSGRKWHVFNKYLGVIKRSIFKMQDLKNFLQVGFWHFITQTLFLCHHPHTSDAELCRRC